MSPSFTRAYPFVMDHGEGPGATWGREAEPGLAVRFRGPEGSSAPDPGMWGIGIGGASANIAS